MYYFSTNLWYHYYVKEEIKIENKENKEIVMIPFVQHESDMNRMERIIKWLVTIIIILISGIAIYLYLPTKTITEEDTTNTQEVNDIQDSEIHQSIGE